jgi:hypothetical protein
MINFVNPYNGEQGATCSVSFGSMADTASVDDNQAEAGYHRSRFMGEWGVIQAKHKKGEVPSGTKVLSFDGPASSGYVFTRRSKLILRKTDKATKETTEVEFTKTVQQAHFSAKTLQWSVPRQADNKGIAAFMAKPPVNLASTSEGSLTDEDVTVKFVQIRDKMAEEQGVTGVDVELDRKVYREIADKSGYTPAEVKAKIDAYKAAGNKLNDVRRSLARSGKTKKTA